MKPFSPPSEHHHEKCMTAEPKLKDRPEEPLSITAFHLLLVPLLLLLPILIWRLQLPIVSYTFGPRYGVFELFIFFTSVALIINFIVEVRKRKDRGFSNLLPIILFTLLGLYFVSQTSEYYPKSSDWLIRERAAQAIVAGRSPYVEDSYLYPPITAEVLALAYRGVAWGASVLRVPADTEFFWDGVFYLYQNTQFFLIMTAFVLCFRLLQRLNMKDPTIAIIVAALFVFNMPLMRTIRNHQVNLWMLDCILVALIMYRRSSFLTGMATALGAHIKLYPAALLLPLVLMKQFRTIIWFLLGGTILVLLQTGWGTDFQVWNDFGKLLTSFPQGTAFRDNSLHSLLYNTFLLSNSFIGLNEKILDLCVMVSVWAATLAVLAWFLVRYARREQSFHEVASTNPEETVSLRDYRSLGHLLDAIPLMLMLSPIVWEHHYILAIPFVLWSIATQGMQKPWQISIAAFLIFAIPTFDVFPFSYHRLAGLCTLVYYTPPTIAPTPARESVLNPWI
jgi:hypothetical protein